MNLVSVIPYEGYQILCIGGRLTYDCIGSYKEEIKKSYKVCDGYIFDLTCVTQIDSTGMGMLINALKELVCNGDRVVIVNEEDFIMKLLKCQD